MIDVHLFDKEETKQFYKKTNTLVFAFLKSSFKYFFLGKITISKRYMDKAFSLLKNKRKHNYPKKWIKHKKKIAVYTALYGDYDGIKSIKHHSQYCDFFIFTDRKVAKESGWKKRNYVFPTNVDDNVKKNRFLKMHPHLLFPEYDFSIYLDAVFVIELDIVRFMARMGDKKLGLFRHYAGTNCLYDEAETIKRVGKANVDEVNSLMERYRKEGFPRNFGFFECGIIVRDHNDENCKIIMNRWWNEFISGVKRDQLSFMYAVWKSGFDSNFISNLGLTYWIEPVLTGIAHKKS